MSVITLRKVLFGCKVSFQFFFIFTMKKMNHMTQSLNLRTEYRKRRKKMDQTTDL